MDGNLLAIVAGSNYSTIFGGKNRDWNPNHQEEDLQEHISNARLFAASPKLLAALIGARKYVCAWNANFICVAYQAEFNNVGWVGEWVIYLFFEYGGSWVIGGAILCFSSIFDVKQRYLNQKFSFNLDPMELGADKYVVKIELNNYHKDSPHQLFLYRTVREKDLTGEYVLFRHEHTFPHQERHFYTKEKVTEILKDYFDAKRVFQVEGTTGKEVIVEVKPKQAEVIIIPQGD